MSIEDTLKNIIAMEGGFVDDPDDNGGATKYGITQKTLTSWRAKECSKDDVATLSKAEAREIYYAWYYIKPGFQALPKTVQPIMVDMAVNHGASKAVKMLQDVLTCYGYDIGKIDGKLGKKTHAGVLLAESEMGNQLINGLVNRRILFYQSLVQENPSQLKFLTGWTNRAESYRVA